MAVTGLVLFFTLMHSVFQGTWLAGSSSILEILLQFCEFCLFPSSVSRNQIWQGPVSRQRAAELKP